MPGPTMFGSKHMPISRHTHPHEKLSQLGSISGNPEIAEQGHLKAGAESEALDGGYGDLIKIIKVHVKIDEGIEILLELLEGEVLQRIDVQRDVAAGGEMIPGAGEDEGPYCFVFLHSGKALCNPSNRSGLNALSLSGRLKVTIA